MSRPNLHPQHIGGGEGEGASERDRVVVVPIANDPGEGDDSNESDSGSSASGAGDQRGSYHPRHRIGQAEMEPVVSFINAYLSDLSHSSVTISAAQSSSRSRPSHHRRRSHQTRTRASSNKPVDQQKEQAVASLRFLVSNLAFLLLVESVLSFYLDASATILVLRLLHIVRIKSPFMCVARRRLLSQ